MELNFEAHLVYLSLFSLFSTTPLLEPSLRSIPSIFRSTELISTSSLSLQASGLCLCIPVFLLGCLSPYIFPYFITLNNALSVFEIISPTFIKQMLVFTNLSDLHRYLLYHFPLISALMGVMSNFSFLSLIIILSFLQFNLGGRRTRGKVRCSKVEHLMFNI